MKRILFAMGLALASASPWAATNVGVSVHINQPGVYGRVDIGQVAAPPTLIYTEPVIINPGPVVHRAPIYLHVPPGHSRNWRRYCGHYNACGQPVYFVQDNWYRQHYHRPAPQVHRLPPPPPPPPRYHDHGGRHFDEHRHDGDRYGGPGRGHGGHGH